GSFMVRGKRETKQVPVKLAIGMLPDKRLMAGPESAVSKHCTNIMQIVQGDLKPSDAAKKIQKYIGTGEPDEIIRLLPAGELRVIGNVPTHH
ncbi:MAG: fibronectin-binding domain-containing protein, partial [Nanoarchaeota archaeon]